MSMLVQMLAEAGVLSPLDQHFARAMGNLAPDQPDEVLLGAAMASRAMRYGHVCADLRRLHASALLDRNEQPVRGFELPGPDPWYEALSRSPLVGTGEQPTPLVLDREGRLYLRRYWQYEQRLARGLAAHVRDVEGIDIEILRDGMQRLFPESSGPHALQRQAAVLACLRALTVVSGGPGTGKTTVVLRMLALLLEQAPDPEALRIVLLAPTGKAAQRLTESIESGREALACSDAIRAAIPGEASTIHRALGYQPRSPTRFRHDGDNPLPADVVLVDEASMIDVALMTKLVEAVPGDARLILIGDKDQLASVEAGAILGDIYNSDADHTYSAELSARLHALLGTEPVSTATGPQIELPLGGQVDGGAHIVDCMVHLTHSWRYRAGSGIAELARAVNSEDHNRAVAVLREDGKGKKFSDVRLVPPDAGGDLARDLGARAVEGFSAFLEADDPEQRLAHLARFRILCAHRGGPRGVEATNRVVEQMLQSHNILGVTSDWYDGRPIMITRNDYQLSLFNGDVGVLATDRTTGQIRAYFSGRSSGELRAFAPARLPPHETVFAMTVHKSQGSEFDDVMLILPLEPSPITTRELIYTGITRARRSVQICGPEHVLAHAIQHPIERASGLRDALWRTGRTKD